MTVRAGETVPGTDTVYRSGCPGASSEPPEIDWDAATPLYEDARRVYREVLEPRLEREADEQARGDREHPTRSRFL